MFFKTRLLLGVVFCASISFGQDYFPENDGLKTKNTNYTVFTNATIHITPTETIKKATLVIQKG